MHRRLIILLWLIVSANALLAGCGQKGPLYMPDPAKQQEEEEKK